MPRKGIMLANPFEEKRLLKWTPPFIVQPKLDGVRCRAVLNLRGSYTLLSSEEKEIISVPSVIYALNSLGQKPPELDGELYTHGLPFEDILSITSRTVNLHPDHQLINYHIFDLVEPNEPQVLRTFHLMRFEDILLPPLIRVEHILCNNLDDILRAYDSFISQGYEGIIVRHYGANYVRKRSLYMMKFKPKKDDYYKIVGYKEEVSIHGEPKGRLGALVCNGGGGDTFNVGTGLTDDTRSYLWLSKENLIGKLAHVKYQHITAGKGVPRFPVFVEIIDVEPLEVQVGL